MNPDTKKKIIKWFWIVLLGGLGTILVWLTCVAIFADLPSFRELEDPKSNLATLLYSEDGKVFNTFHLENRSFVSREDLPQSLVDAAVATEDARFYKHSGIDFTGLARVGFKTILLSDSSQGGGSTITQQLAKSLFGRDTTMDHANRVVYSFKMVNTKFKEWLTAVKLERNYTKDEIVTMYLNTIFFGSNAFGIRAAAATYFAKTPQELSVEESACLVGIVNKPTRYNPVLNYDQSLARRNYVLKQMRRNGYISQHECDSLSALPITLNYRTQDHNAGIGAYFRDMLYHRMNAKKPQRSSYSHVEDYRADSLLWKDDPLYGWLEKNPKPDGERYNLYTDGLRIYTTLDSRMQRYAEEAVAEHLGRDLQPIFNNELAYKTNAPFSNDVPADIRKRLMNQAMRWSDRWRGLKREGYSDKEAEETFMEKVPMRVFAWNKKHYIDTVMTPYDSIRYYKSFLRSAMVAIEPHTGKIKAYVGGPDYRFFKYDNAGQGKRQVGSTIKPYLYTLAMQEGFNPCSKVVNVPYSFPVGDTVWTPHSTDKAEYIGRTVTLKWGLTHSSNNISAYLMKQFGPVAMVEMCHKMGVSSWLDPVFSLCVGSCDLSVMEMVAAYNTYPSRGVYTWPMMVTRIEDKSGNVLATFSPHKREAISDPTAYLMVNLMQGVVNEGTASRLRWKYNLPNIAGKTGTTNDHSDGWFIGYSPKLTAGVWTGAEDRQVHFESLYYGGGANMALPIYGLFMQKVYSDPSIGIGPDDVFVAPLGWNMNLTCTGSSDDDLDGGNTGGDNNYFD